MPSQVTWLDHSEADQQRIRELLGLFSARETVDDLGIGTIRDAVSNQLFPGTSTLQTRARYLLFIPWIYSHVHLQYPRRLIAQGDRCERELIGALRRGGATDGLIGATAGEQLKTLPSALYWGALSTYGIFSRPGLSLRQYGRMATGATPALDVEDELAVRHRGFWDPELPTPPAKFFLFDEATFDLTGNEASWLCERIISSCPSGSEEPLLAGLCRGIQAGGSPPVSRAPWLEQLPASASDESRQLVADARCFSAVVHGAAILYNLMLAEAAQEAGLELDGVTDPDEYRARLATWQDSELDDAVLAWCADTSPFVATLSRSGARIPQLTAQFLARWAETTRRTAGTLADDRRARELIRGREWQHKGSYARLSSAQRLALWTGMSGVGALTFRWPQVSRLLTDVHDGLRRTA